MSNLVGGPYAYLNYNNRRGKKVCLISEREIRRKEERRLRKIANKGRR